MDAGGWLWLLIDVVGVVVLAGALVYAMMLWRRRRKNHAFRQHQNEVVRENYRKGG